MLRRFLYYWNRDTDAIWEIAYRRRPNGGILADQRKPFSVFQVEKGFWAADPLAVEHDGKDYLFFEYYDVKKEKGLVAYSVMEEGQLTTPRVVLEESYHLSFPFVFMVHGEYYMIPETGTQNNVILYKCERFPDKWKRERTLLSNISSSDTIIFSKEGKIYCLASILQNNRATEAENQLYVFDPVEKTLRYCCTSENTGFDGVRNAGGMFQNKDKTIRPGQVGELEAYGKAIKLFEVENVSDSAYREKAIGTIYPKDILVDTGKVYAGIHTYSCTERYEFVDLKQMAKVSLPRRIKAMANHVLIYCKQHISKPFR